MQLDHDRLYHNSGGAWLELRDTPDYRIPKPEGLWVARGSTWIDFAERAPLAQPLPHVFEIGLGTANVLVIDGHRTYDWFTYTFGVSDVREINWTKVREQYDGVEVRDNALIDRRQWSKMWRVASGCIWGASKCEVLSYHEEPKYRIQLTPQYQPRRRP